MRYATVCSGIEAPSCAWHPLGWQPMFFSEIEKFPCAVLEQRWSGVPNLGDMTRFQEWPDAAFDLLCGGTPCQSFSVAGLRKGLDDPRGNLMLTYLAIAARYRPRWVVWENVPGVLSSWSGADETGALHPGQDEWEGDETSDFACFLAGLEQLGYGVSYRIFDAQFAGLAQRRERVFVVGCLGDWRGAAAVFLERASVRGDSAPSRKAGKGTSAATAPSLTASGRGVERSGESRGQDPVVAVAQNASGELRTGAVANTLNTNTNTNASEDGTGRGTPLVPICFSAKDHGGDAGEIAPTLRAGGHAGSHANAGVMPAVAFRSNMGGNDGGVYEDGSTSTITAQMTPAVAFDARQSDVIQYGDKTGPLDTDGHTIAVRQAMMVRRLTPRECERLMGFEDDYTLITYRGKPAADGPRYKALGNSMAAPVLTWIGRRIALVDSIVFGQ